MLEHLLVRWWCGAGADCLVKGFVAGRQSLHGSSPPFRPPGADVGEQGCMSELINAGPSVSSHPDACRRSRSAAMQSELGLHQAIYSHQSSTALHWDSSVAVMAGRKDSVQYFPAAMLGYGEVLHIKHGAIGSSHCFTACYHCSRHVFLPSTCGL